MLWNYYVTARYGKRTVALLGPYETHTEALENVEQGRTLALDYDQTGRAHFAAYGTSRIHGPVSVAFNLEQLS